MDLLITQSMIKHKNNPSTSSSYFNERSIKKRNSLAQQKPGMLTVSSGGQSGRMDIEEDESSTISYMMDEGADHTAAAANHKRKEFMIQELIKSANLRLNLYVNNENIKKKQPVLVEVFLIFLRVGEIDNVKERFQADAYFEASWEDDSLVNAESGVFDPHLNWEPELFIENAVGNLKQDVKYRIERSKDSNMVRIHEMRNIRGIFWERLELWDFPLDIQSLSITITSSRNKNEVLFAPSRYNECTINTNDFQQQQEWNLYSHVEISKKYIYDAWNKHERPCFTISSTISRRPGYYLYNAYMLIFLISILGFVPFSISCKLPHFRIQTTCLLILSSINFRWIVTQKLPTVSYLTTLDKYAIGALIFLVLLCVWHAFIGSEIFLGFTLDYIISIDQFALLLIGIMYILFHIIYMTHFILRYKRYKKIGPNTNLIGSTSSVESPFTDYNLQMSELKSEMKASESVAITEASSNSIRNKAESKMC